MGKCGRSEGWLDGVLSWQLSVRQPSSVLESSRLIGMACMCRYFGPCSDDLQSFADMSISAKKRGSKNCQVFCGSCIGVAGRDVVAILMSLQAYFPCKSDWHVRAVRVFCMHVFC